MNPIITGIVNECLPLAGNPEDDTVIQQHRDQLINFLSEREDTMRDQLLMVASGQGLMPSITALAMVQVGLGTPPPEEQVALLQQQAMQEIAELNHRMEEFRRQLGGDPGEPGSTD